MSKCILIGIGGGSGSGKTSVAKAIIRDFPADSVALIIQDSYYHDLGHLPFDERERVNVDHPNSLDFEGMRTDLAALVKGKPVSIPQYDYATRTRKPDKTQFSGAHTVVVIEGIFALYDEDLRDLMDMKIYVDTPDDIRILRRIKRDLKERGRDFDGILKQYYDTVRPMHHQFVEPTKRYADLIVPEGAENVVAIDLLRTKVRDVLRSKEL